MHYIRFLKPPRLAPDTPRTLTSKLTITTDLGESFLALDILLLADVEDSSGRVLGRREYLWKGSIGMRALEVALPFPARSQLLTVVARAKEDEISVSDFDAVLDDASIVFKDDEDEERGRVMGVRSMEVDVTGKGKTVTGMAERVFHTRSRTGAAAFKTRVHIWEETGESIARHIWDAGLVLSAYLARVCTEPPSQPSTGHPNLPLLEARLRQQDLKVLELGAGCGIVSLTLATYHPSISKILMTDLPEATEILTHNLSLLKPSTTKPNSNPETIPKITQQTLDWSQPLPPNINSTRWNLILVADCTYNPDVVPHLVQTLRSIVVDRQEGGSSQDALICLAMKVRHESEMVVFRLIHESGFMIVERCVVPLPVLAGENEEIQIFVFASTKV